VPLDVDFVEHGVLGLAGDIGFHLHRNVPVSARRMYVKKKEKNMK